MVGWLTPSHFQKGFQMFHVYSRDEHGRPQNDRDDTLHEFDKFGDAVDFQQNEVANGYVVESQRFSKVRDVASHMMNAVADDAFVSLKWDDVGQSLVLRTVCEFKEKQEDKDLYLHIETHDGKSLGDTPINSDFEACDGSYGLIEYCEEQIGQSIGAHFGEIVETHLLEMLRKSPTETACFMGFTGKIITED